MAESLLHVQDVMSRDVVWVPPHLGVKDLLRLMSDRHIGGVPVVDDGRVIGVVSESDLIFREARVHPPRLVSVLDAILPVEGIGRLEEELRRAVGVTARDLMSHPAITIAPGASLEDAATRMVEEDIDRMPVVDPDGRLVGMLTRHDIVRALANRL